jgi:hypothetical protein
MRRLVIALALAALSGAADAREAPARSGAGTPSILVEDREEPPKAERGTPSRAGSPKRSKAARIRHPVQQSTSVRYRSVTVPRQEINDVGRNLRLRSDDILRRQQLEMRRDSQINVLRSEIQRQQFNRTLGAPYRGYGPGGYRY